MIQAGHALAILDLRQNLRVDFLLLLDQALEVRPVKLLVLALLVLLLSDGGNG